MSSNILFPFQLLELNVISAQDLAPVARNLRTYAVAWVHPDRRLSTRVDTTGHTNPTWNDKFVFRVDDEFLYTDTSAVMIEIYALHWFRDIHVGTVRVLVGNLIPPPSRPHHPNHHIGMRFVALQVRRPSGRPQGILNIGVALLDSSMRSMPLLRQFSTSAVGYRHLMGQNPHHNRTSSNNTNNVLSIGKPELRRTKSDSTGSMMTSSEYGRKKVKTKKPVGSIIDGSEVEYQPKKKGKSRASSMISGSSSGDYPKIKGKKGKSRSLISGNTGSNSILSGSEIGTGTKKGKPSSIINGIESKPAAKPAKDQKPVSEVVDLPNGKASPKLAGMDLGFPLPKGTPLKQFSKFNMADYGSPRKPGLFGAPFLTESELGPSPSEVAAAVAARDMMKVAENESSIVGGWSLDGGSVEGLQSKLERWRSELPPVYDRGEFSSFPSSARTRSGHNRRRTEGDEGLFSCFSNICGCEVSIVCGQGSTKKKKKGSGRIHISQSENNLSYV